MIIDLLRKRRSIRKFEDKSIENEKIDILVEALLRSPSSRSLNPWEFVVVTDREIIGKLAKAKTHGSSFLARAPLAIVVSADPAKCDVWVEDCSIAALIAHLTAADLGLGSCWIQIRKRDHNSEVTSEEYVRNLIGLSEDRKVEAIIAIGYPAENLPGHAYSTLQFDKVRYL